MSSPSPGPQSGADHTYQPSDTSDHGLILHSCQCAEKCPIDQSKCEQNHTHCLATSKNKHHHIINTATHPHPSKAVHVHIHPPPNTGHLPKIPPPTCSCHLQIENESNQELHDGSGNLQTRKLDADDNIEISPLPPALPPRPPPRPRTEGTLPVRPIPPRESLRFATDSGIVRKYVFWCCACGGLLTMLGSLFLAVYFLLRSYTSTLEYFETIPTFVPATMLIVTGMCVISLARRKNRYSYLIKVCGLCCLVCALTCVLVTITTTVIHMNRLQTLRECVYTQKTRTCTCYSVLLEAHATTDEGMRFVFDSTPDCEVIHGALYSCLRAMFGLSVSGILVCIFSSMLVYQLLTHEKKKMYWDQLELRCRALYQTGTAPPSTRSSMRDSAPLPNYCSLCEQCGYPSATSDPHLYPWRGHHAVNNFWTAGRVSNFYSPTPGEELPQSGGELHNRERPISGWNWRRLPWSRGSAPQPNIAESHRDNSLTYQGISSSDSQYGFSNPQGVDSNVIPADPLSGSSGSYSVLENRPLGGVYVWGPPPPYSNPNSPARRIMASPARYHHIHHQPHVHNSQCQMNQENQPLGFQDLQMRQSRKQLPSKDNYENTAETERQHNDNSESTDTSSCMDRVAHTLPVRKLKKRADVSSVKTVLQHAPNSRTNVQTVFNQNCHAFSGENEKTDDDHSYHDPDLSETHKQGGDTQSCRFLPRLQGVENAAFQNQENSSQKPEATESEVYFADVSSCCNISVKNDGQDSSLYDEALDIKNTRLVSLQKPHIQSEKEIITNNQILQNFQENISSATVTEDEEYLAHRLGQRQMSTRSRLPFPLPNTDDIPEINADPCMQLIPKDISQNSLCSSVQTPHTETTDDALTPTSPSFPDTECCLNYFPDKNTNVEQRHRAFSKSNVEQFLAPDAQYEIIQEQSSQNAFRHNFPTSSNLTNTISGLHNYDQNYHSPNFNNQNVPSFSSSNPKNIPPKSLNLNQSPNRRNLGSNISNLIQNLGVNPVGLLYGDAIEDEETQAQESHSDGTMDSGWQSGSEKQDRNGDNTEKSTHRALNV